MILLEDWWSDWGSLSQRLARCFSEPQVQLLDRLWQHQTPYGLAFVRRVVLWVDGKPFLYAESFLPKESLTKDNQFFLTLGGELLGHYLFDKTEAKRIALSSSLHRLNTLPSFQTSGGVAPARHSQFLMNGCPLFLHEYFLPNMVVALSRLHE